MSRRFLFPRAWPTPTPATPSELASYAACGGAIHALRPEVVLPGYTARPRCVVREEMDSEPDLNLVWRAFGGPVQV